MAGVTTFLSISTLNVNGSNSPIKRHPLANWIKKEDLAICSLQETHLTDRNSQAQKSHVLPQMLIIDLKQMQ
jgi:exonuclease III